MENHGHDTTPALPWLDIPSCAISVVEHPCIIKNVDKGIVSLGGAAKLSKALRSNPRPPSEDEDEVDAPGPKLTQYVSASLRPDDPTTKKLLSTPVTTENLLIKVTVPKRTGRKRKKGSSGPFLYEHEIATASEPTTNAMAPVSPYVPVETVMRSIRDNPDKYTMTPAGVIVEAHRFRSVPDIQIAAFKDKAVTELKDQLMPLRWNQLKNLWTNEADEVGNPKLPENPAQDSEPLPTSAEYIQIPVHHNYKFKQNTFIKYTGDEREEVNIQKRMTVDGYYFIECDAETVPKRPKDFLPPEETLSYYVRALVEEIREELLERPIITRHMLYNRLGWDKRDMIRQAAVYCGYFFTTGPWREALIAWGVDPRQHPKYRHYQTISFISFAKVGPARNRFAFSKHIQEMRQRPAHEVHDEHIFNGVNLGTTGNIFMFCDITDPMIRKILDTPDIRSSCALTVQGWYHSGTWAKATVIMKHKMQRLQTGKPIDDSLYELVLTWPEIWNDADVYNTYRDEMYDREIHKERFEEHRLLNNVRWAARNPKLAFTKIEEQERMDEGQERPVPDGKAEAELEVPEDLTENRDGAEAILDEAGVDDDESESAESDLGGFDDGDTDDEEMDAEGSDDDGGELLLASDDDADV